MTEEYVTPQMHIDYYTTQQHISVEDVSVAPVIVLSWSHDITQSFADTVGAQSCPHWLHQAYYPLFTGEISGRRVSFAQVPMGVPATVMMMEEMIACGARTFWALGWTGSLQPFAPVGTLLIPTGCIREEGTSFHYLDGDVRLSPDEHLVELLRSTAQMEGAHVVSGIQWTTDAPYRELQSKIASYRQQGVIGVDMETSAMYALATFRGVKVCNLLVTSNEMWQAWRPAFGSPEVMQAIVLAQRVILKCLEYDLEFE
jgi:uridine phosphorylase